MNTEPFATITATRGDRPKFFNFCLHQIARFDPAPSEYFIIDHPPLNDQVDLTLRVRLGITAAKAKGIDLVYIVEDDDNYAKDYFAKMAMPDDCDFIGCSKSLYYNIRNRTYNTFNHPNRSSLFCTGFRISALDRFSWPPDDTIFLDLILWKYAMKHRYKLIDEPVGVGIKHGQGKTAGTGHRMEMPNQDDEEMTFLKSRVDKEAFIFYRSVCG